MLSSRNNSPLKSVQLAMSASDENIQYVVPEGRVFRGTANVNSTASDWFRVNGERMYLLDTAVVPLTLVAGDTLAGGASTVCINGAEYRS